MKLSIRKFLLVNLLLAITVTTSLTVIGSYYLNEQDIQDNSDQLLMRSALYLKSLAGENIKPRAIKEIQQDLNTIPHVTKTYFPKLHQPVTDYEQSYQFQIWSKDKLILESAHSPKISMIGAKPGFNDIMIDGKLWRTFTITDSESKYTFVVGEHYATRKHFVQRIIIDDIYILFLTYPLSGLLIWFIIGRGLRSINKVTKEVSRRAADHLEPVDLEAVPSEIKPLVDELNKLFLRLKQAFEREQRFAADAAHELRTPLAALRTQAQVALKTSDQAEKRTHLNNVIIGVDRCTHVIQQLLTLCRVSPESATLEDPSLVDLPKIATDVIAQLVPSALDKKIEIELITDKDDDCHIIGNATGLYALIRNLVDNAIRYTPSGGAIRVIIKNIQNFVTIKVIDNGPGIPAELRSRVFERFFRVLGTNTQGSGLGLAIVQQIVKLHKGNVALGVPQSGVGLEVEVLLPKDKDSHLE